MKRWNSLRVKIGFEVIILAIIFSVALQCQSNKFPTSEKTTTPSYKETLEPYITGPSVPDNTINIIFNESNVLNFIQRFRDAGYVMNTYDSTVIYNVYDAEDSAWHRLYFIPLNHPTEKKEANVLFVREGADYTVSAHIWESSPGMVDTIVFEGVEFPFHDIWCYQLYGAVHVSGGEGTSGGYPLRDPTQIKPHTSLKVSAPNITLPPDSVMWEYLNCWNQGAQAGCIGSLGTCIIGAVFFAVPGIACFVSACGGSIITAGYICYKEHVAKWYQKH